jgi:GNAT superfamily N-acetyltransferase
MEFRERVARLAFENGCSSDDEFRAWTGISERTYRRIKSENRITNDIIDSLCSAFRLTRNQLFEGVDKSEIDRFINSKKRMSQKISAGLHLNLTVNILCVTANLEEAAQYQDLIRNEGFKSQTCGSFSPSQFETCHLVLVFLTSAALESERFREDLDKVWKLQGTRNGFQPLVIFLTKDHGGEEIWQSTIGIKGNRYVLFCLQDKNWANELLSIMKPKLVVTGDDAGHHLSDEQAIRDTGVFNLYKDAFPPTERDRVTAILDWVLRTDIGITSHVKINEDIKFSFRLFSRLFIYIIANKTVGMAFVTYDFETHLSFLNYFAVDERWQGIGIGRTFLDQIEAELRRLHKRSEGIVFEVEKLTLET